MNKKLAIIAVLSTVALIFGGMQSSLFYGTQYMEQSKGYNYNVASSITWWDCNWSYCKKITIDHTKVQSDQTNYPVLLYRGTDSDLATHAQNDGDDIAFVNQGNTTQYKHEIEKFDGGTGELVSWVKVSSVSSTEDTILYMYYGNPSCESQEDITSTWDDNFALVQHLNETSGSITYDSTTNNNDGTINSASANSSSKIDGGYDFSGSDNISVSDAASLDISNSITLEGWVKDPPWLSTRFKPTVEIVDKREERIFIDALKEFSVNRKIKSNIETEVIFAAVHTSNIKINDIKIDNSSILDSSYNRDKITSNSGKRLEKIIKNLPEKIKELDFVAVSKPFILNFEKKIQITAMNIDKTNQNGRISYILLSEDDLYDYETTTHCRINRSYNFLTKSCVDTILMRDCFLSSLSLDHKSQLNLSDNAKKSTSSGSGDTFFALDKNSLYSSFLTKLTTVCKNLKIKENWISDKEKRFNISDLCLSNSFNANSGEYNINDDNVDNSRDFDFSLKKENKIFVSTTNFIQKNPCFLSLLNLPFLKFLPNFIKSSSLRFFAPFISSSMNPINFLRFSSNITSSSMRFSSRGFSFTNILGSLISKSSMFNTNNSITPDCLNSFSTSKNHLSSDISYTNQDSLYIKAEIVDKKEEELSINPFEEFTVNRTIRSNIETEVIFAAVHTSNIKINDILVDNRSVFNSSYNRNKITSNSGKRLENIITNLPEKIKELDFVDFSKPFNLNFEKNVQINAVSIDKINQNGRISYILLSEDDLYDYETTTHLKNKYNNLARHISKIPVNKNITNYLAEKFFDGDTEFYKLKSEEIKEENKNAFVKHIKVRPYLQNKSTFKINTNIPETRYSEQINLTSFLKGQNLEVHNYKLLDTNNNNLFDTIEWNVTSSSEIEFETTVDLKKVNHSAYQIDTVDNYDGTYSDFMYIGIQNYYNRSEKRYKPVDTSIKSLPNGNFINKENNFKTTYKNKPGKDFLEYKVNNSDITYSIDDLSFADINNVDAIVDNNTLTYPEIYDGIDLKYTITSSQLIEEFIVKNRSTGEFIAQLDKPEIEMGFTTKNTYFVEESDGSISFYDRKTDRILWVIPKPVMYELDYPFIKNYGIYYEVTKTGNEYIISKVIDEEGKEWLTNSDRLYPVVIDLTATYKMSTTNCKAEYDVASSTPQDPDDAAWSPYSSAQETETTDNDENYNEWNMVPCEGDPPQAQGVNLWYEYDITQTRSWIDQIDAYWNGKSSSAWNDVELKIWNHDTSGWESKDSHSSSGSDFTLQATVSSSITNYVDESGLFHVCYEGEGCQILCFLSDTNITMADGSKKNIEDIQIDDMVKSYNQTTGEIVDAKVTKVFQHEMEEMGEYYLIINNNIRVTPNHMFYTGKGWKPAGLLKVGDRLFNFEKDYTTIKSIEKKYEKAKTYNFHVEKYNVYYANDMLVHNFKCPLFHTYDGEHYVFEDYLLSGYEGKENEGTSYSYLDNINFTKANIKYMPGETGYIDWLKLKIVDRYNGTDKNFSNTNKTYYIYPNNLTGGNLSYILEEDEKYIIFDEKYQDYIVEFEEFPELEKNYTREIGVLAHGYFDKFDNETEDCLRCHNTDYEDYVYMRVTYSSDPPDTSIDDIPATAYPSDVSTITGGSTDDVQVNNVYVGVRNLTDNTYWCNCIGGNQWDDACDEVGCSGYYFPASAQDGSFNSGDEDWTFTPSNTWVDRKSYRVYAKAYDSHSQWDPTPAQDTFTYSASNSAPEIDETSESPTNGSTGVSTTPQCSINVSDPDSDNMMIQFWENSTGTWTLRQTNESVGDGTYRWTYSQANSDGTKYWWRVRARDLFRNQTPETTWDPDSAWSSETSAYDGNTGTYATCSTPESFLYLNVSEAPVDCSAVRVYAASFEEKEGASIIGTLDIHNENGWITIGEGELAANTWTTFENGGELITIDSARIMFAEFKGTIRLKEFAFVETDENTSTYEFTTESSNNAPTIDSFNLVDEGNAGWDLDNDNFTFDCTVSDSDSNTLTYLFTFSTSGSPADPTTGSYYARITGVTSGNYDKTNYDLAWEEEPASGWVDTDGTVTVKMRVHDGTDYSTTVESDTFSNGIDGTPPSFDTWTQDADDDSGGDGYAPNTGYEDDSTCQGDFSGCTDATSGIAASGYKIKSNQQGSYGAAGGATDRQCTLNSGDNDIYYNITDNAGNTVAGDTGENIFYGTTDPTDFDIDITESSNYIYISDPTDISSGTLYYNSGESDTFNISVDADGSANWQSGGAWKVNFSAGFGVGATEDTTPLYDSNLYQINGASTTALYVDIINNCGEVQNITLTTTDDTTNPSISLSSEEENSIFLYKEYSDGTAGVYGSQMSTTQDYWINGTASDATGVDTITDNTAFGDNPSNAGTNESWVFQYQIDADDNTNTTVTYTATDYVGNTGTTQYTFKEDNSAPTLTDAMSAYGESGDTDEVYGVTGTNTFYFSNSFDSSATATFTATGTDAGDAGVYAIHFGTFGGDTPGNDTTSDYQGAYTINDDDSAGSITVTIYDNVANTDSGTITCTEDTTGPDAPTYVLCSPDSYGTGGEWDDDTNIYVNWSGENDAGSGVEDYYMEYNDDTPEEQASGGDQQDNDTGAEGLCTFYVRGKDNVGNWGTSANDTITIDLTAPTLDDAIFTDEGYGTNWYDQGSDSQATMQVNWTETNPAYVNITVTGLTDQYYNDTTPSGGSSTFNINISGESDGDYTITYKIADNASNTDTTVSGTDDEPLRLDNTGPDAPTYVLCSPDSYGTGGEWDNDTTIYVNWSGENDAGSGVEDYYMEYNDETPEEASGQDQQDTDTGAENQECKFYVRGKDNLGNWGTTTNDTIKIDTENPDTAIDPIADESTPTTITGEATDPVYGIVHGVNLTIKNETDDTYWTGSSWGTITWLSADPDDAFDSNNEAWTYDNQDDIWDYDKWYVITANTSDYAGNDDPTPAKEHWNISAANTAPTISAFDTIPEGNNNYDLDNNNISINWTVTDTENDDLWLLFNYSAGGTPGIPTNDSYQGKIAITNGGSPGYSENDYNLAWTDSSGWTDTTDNINITFRVYDGALYSDFYNDTNNITGIDGTNPTSLSIYDISEDTKPGYLHFNGSAGIYYSNAGTGNRVFTVYVEASDATSGLDKATFPATVSGGGDDDSEAGGDYEYTYQYTASGDGETFDSAATVTVYDIAGNSATVNFDVLLDDTAPTFDTFTLDADTDSDGGDDIAPNTGWYDDLTIQGDFSGCTDAKAGIANYSIQTDSDGLGTADTDGTDVGCTAAGEGTSQNINYNISDNVGNTDAGDTTIDVNIDTTPPASPDAMTGYSESGDTDEVYAKTSSNKFYFSNSFDSSATVNFTGNFTDDNKWKANYSSFGGDDPSEDTTEDYNGEYTIDDSDTAGTITFYGYDQAGNNANDTIDCIEDTTNPSISITSEDENSIYLYKDYGTTQQGYYGSQMAGTENYWINGTASDTTGVDAITDGASFGDNPSNTGTNESWVFLYQIDATDNGATNITFTATDYVGNTGTTWYQFYEDNQNPVSGLTDIPASISDLNNINGTSTDNVSVDWVKIYIKNTTADPDTYWTGSSWTDSITWLGATANDSTFDSNSEGWNVDTTSITWSDGSSYEVNATTYDIVNNSNFSTDSFTISQEDSPLASYYSGVKNTYGGKQTNDWKTNHTDADGASDVDDCYLRVGEDGGNNFTLAYNPDNNSYWVKDGDSYVISIDNVYNTSITNGYTVDWNFTVDWDFPFDDSDFDVAAYTDDEDGDNSGYQWSEAGTTTHENDLIIYSITEYTLNDSAYSEDGDTTLTEDEWFRGGVQVKCSGVVTYEGTSNVYPPSTAVDVHLWANGIETSQEDDTLGASGEFETAYNTTVSTSGIDADYDFNVSLSEFTTGAAQGTGETTTLRNASRDNEAPDTPTYVLCSPDSYGTGGEYDDDTTIYVNWTGEGDGSGSGVDDYYMEYNDDTPEEEASGQDQQDTDTGAEGLCTFYVRGKDNVGNWGTSASDTITIDLTDPTLDTAIFQDDGYAPNWYDQGSDDYAWIRLTWTETNPKWVNITVDGIDTYTNTTPADGVTDFNISINGESDGDYTITYIITDQAGRTDTTVSGTDDEPLRLDNTGPDAPTYVLCSPDSYGTGGEWDNDTTIYVNWSGENDAGSGVEDYYMEYNDDTPEEEASGGDQQDTDTGAENQECTFYVRGKDNLGNWGTTTNDTIKIDTENPDTAIDAIADESTPTTITGDATDPVYGIVHGVNLTIKNETDDTYWTGSEWSATETWLKADPDDAFDSNNEAWTYDNQDGIWTTNKWYVITANTSDYAGNNDPTPAKEHWNISSADEIPYVENVTITSAYNFTLDDLTGSGDYYDNQSDAESGSSYEWYESKDASTWTTLGVNSTTLDSNYTNESWYYKFEYTPRNVNGTGTARNSSALQIAALDENAGTYSGNYNENGNLTIANGGTLTISGISDFEGNITVQNGGILDIGSQNHEFGSLTINNNGNFTSTTGSLFITDETDGGYAIDIDGNFTHNSGLIKINTSTNSNIDINTQNGNLYNLYINSGSAQITSNAAATINNNITVQTGIIAITASLTTNEMQIDNGATFNINSSATFTMTNILTQNGIFNIYNGEAININLTNTLFNLTNAEYISIHKTPDTPTNPNGYGNLGEYVNLSSIQGGATVDINISYQDSNLGDVLESTLTIWEYNWSTGIWTEASSTNVNTTSNWVWATGITSFSPFGPLGEENFAPTVTNPNPSDTATGVSITQATVSALINDSDGDTMNWTIEVSITGDTNSSNDAGNGTIECDLTTPLSNSVTYTWYVNVTDSYHWTNVSYTFTTIAANKGVISKGQNAYSLELNPAGNTIYGYINGNTVSTSTDTNWHHVTMTFDGSQIRIYVDGAFQDNTSYSGTINTNNNDLVLGEAFTGTLDELRISNTARSATWINTTYHNTNNPTTFATFGTQKGILSTFSYRKKIWINHSMIDSNLNNFPVLVSTTDTDLKNNAHTTGNDIIFMDSSTDWDTGDITNRYPHEIEKWEPVTGELVSWVKLDTVSSTTNTSFYMYYGSTCTSDKQDVQNVWDSNYVGVWHMADASNDITDSSGSTFWNGTRTGSPSSIAGKIGNAADLNNPNANDGNCFVVGDLDLTGDFTVEYWGKYDSIAGWRSTVMKNTDYGFEIEDAGNGNDLRGRVNSDAWGAGLGCEDDAISTGVWYYHVMTWDETNDFIMLYANNTLVDTYQASDNHTTNNNDLIFGGWSTNSEMMDGILDEIRISSVNRSTAWINASFNTMNDSSTFLDFGSQEIPNVAPTQTNPSPSNGATGQTINPTLRIQVNDTNIDAMNVTFHTNATGSWGLIGYNDSVYNGTYSQTNSSMDSYNTKYYWSVNVTDGTLWTNTTYSFTVSSIHTYLCDDTDGQGYKGFAQDGIFDGADNEFSAGNYSAIDEDDSNYVWNGGALGDLGDYAYHKFNFTIDESTGSISEVNLTWRGNGTDDAGSFGHSLWIYNRSSTSWEELTDGTSSSPEYLYAEKTESITDWISGSGYLEFAAQSDQTALKSELYSYYVQVKITLS